ncbi:hypothetical protein BN440_3365 [Erwinia amylovora MR1]|nr:hypothetical protein BN440_3365 [Erwinia amylovora MR1]
MPSTIALRARLMLKLMPVQKKRIEAEADLNKEYIAAKKRVEYYLNSGQAEKQQYLDNLLAAQRAWLK